MANVINNDNTKRMNRHRLPTNNNNPASPKPYKPDNKNNTPKAFRLQENLYLLRRMLNLLIFYNYIILFF